MFVVIHIPYLCRNYFIIFDGYETKLHNDFISQYMISHTTKNLITKKHDQ